MSYWMGSLVATVCKVTPYSIMWGISAGQYVVGVLWLSLLLQKICKDLEHWFPTILASYSSFLCVIWHADALLSPYLLGLHCVSALAAITFSLIPTGFGTTVMEVTVLCPKMLSSWGSVFTGLKNAGFDLTSGGNLRSWLQLLTGSMWATFLMEGHAQMKIFRHS